MTKPTKAEWAKVKEELSRPYHDTYLNCDGYLVHAHVVVSKMRLTIMVYVNGWFEGKESWHGKESEQAEMSDIARKFYSLTRTGPSAKLSALNLKLYGKKECKDRKINEKRCYAWPIFRTPGALVYHLIRHNTMIELLDYETYKLAINALQLETGNHD